VGRRVNQNTLSSQEVREYERLRKVKEDRYLARQEGREEERLTSFLQIPLAKYTGDVVSHNTVDDCVEISEEGDGPVSGHVRRLDLLK